MARFIDDSSVQLSDLSVTWMLKAQAKDGHRSHDGNSAYAECSFGREGMCWS